MDTSKWRSVLMHVELYERLKSIASAEGRTLSGQLRVIIVEYLNNHNLSTIEPKNP